MEFKYTVSKGEVCINRCIGEGGKVEIPEVLDNIPVCAVGNYAFSNSLGKDEKVNAVCKERLKEVVLPKTLKKIGNYAFYGCRNLKKLLLHQGVEEIGGGAFTGCRSLNNIRIIMDKKGGFCFKNVITELNHEVEVTLILEDKKSKLLFPEYYEEAVENTPAKLLETCFHGSGYRYRQCFSDGEFRFLEYDKLFIDAIAWESEELCIRLALNRMIYPVELSAKYQEMYAEYIGAHCLAAGQLLILEEQMEPLIFIGTMNVWQEKDLRELIFGAGELGHMEMVSYLMDYKHVHYGKQQKRFEL